MRRRVIVGVVLGVLLLSVSALIWFRRRTTRALDRDVLLDLEMVNETQARKHCVALDQDGHERVLPVAAFGKTGFLLKERESLWLSIAVPDNVRLEINFSWESAAQVDGFDIFFDAAPKRWTERWHNPPGYVIQFGGYGGVFNFLARLDNCGPAIPMESAPFKYQKQHHAQIERQGDTVSVRLDNGEGFSHTTPFPFPANGHGRIGFRTWSPAGVQIKHIRVVQLKEQRKSPALRRGNRLLRTGDDTEALQEFLRVQPTADDLKSHEAAMAKAISLTEKLGMADLRNELIQEFQQTYPNSSYNAQLIVSDIVRLWNQGEFPEALNTINSIQEAQRESIIRTILNQPHHPLPDSIAQRFLKMISRISEFHSLNLTGYGLSDLTPIASMKLNLLDAESNRITSLEPLKGMPLTSLNIEENKITDLSPIRDLPLQTLNATSNPLTSLPVFSKCQLHSVALDASQILELDSLGQQPLTNLKVYGVLGHDWNWLPPSDFDDIELIGDLTGFDPTLLASSRVRRLSLVHDSHQPIVVDITAFGNALTQSEALRFYRVDLRNVERLASCGKLSHLGIEFCGLTDIDFLRSFIPGVHSFRSLDLSGNPFSDTHPLKTLSFNAIRLHATNVTDLSFLRNRRLNRAPTLPTDPKLADEIRTLAETWMLRAEMRQAAQQLYCLLYAIITPDADKLKKHAIEVDDHYYALVINPVNYTQAHKMAAALDADLVAFESQEEFKAVYPHLPRYADAWCGLSARSGELYWHERELLRWRPRIMGRMTSCATVFNGGFLFKHADRYYPAIIELTD